MKIWRSLHDAAARPTKYGVNEKPVPVKGSNAAQRREHDKRLGAGTMSRAGANTLTELLELPAKEGLAVLVLMDEVLMYAKEKVIQDRDWQDRLLNFFQ